MPAPDLLPKSDAAPDRRPLPGHALKVATSTYSTPKQARDAPVQKPAPASTPTKKPRLTDRERQDVRDQLFGVRAETSARSPIDATIEQIVNQENQNKFNYLVQDVL
jgi:hypothetical protein